MSAPSAPARRVRIDRLELDLHGITPATAHAAAQALGPALANALASHQAHSEPACSDRATRADGGGRIDAGIVTSPSAGAHDLAAVVARRLAHTIGREGA